MALLFPFRVWKHESMPFLVDRRRNSDDRENNTAIMTILKQRPVQKAYQFFFKPTFERLNTPYDLPEDPTDFLSTGSGNALSFRESSGRRDEDGLGKVC